MTRIDLLTKLSPIIFPQFYSLKDIEGNELILLDTGNREASLGKEKIDKTQMKSYLNHFHIWDNFRAYDEIQIKEFCECVARNLLEKLAQKYDNRKFSVFLEINSRGSIVIRFHQLWDKEPKYYDTDYFTDIIEFKNY
jgi:hypothetical protein